jgi:hypothetical protein
MQINRAIAFVVRVVALAGALMLLRVPTVMAQGSDTRNDESSSVDSRGEIAAGERDEILLRIEARVSLPQGIVSNGIAWLQNLSIPPFAPRDESAAYFNALPSHYSQLSKISYGTAFLNSLVSGNFSPASSGNARRLAIATGMEFVGFKLARSERWHRFWWLPQTLAIGINLGSVRSSAAAAEASGASRADNLALPSRAHRD